MDVAGLTAVTAALDTLERTAGALATTRAPNLFNRSTVDAAGRALATRGTFEALDAARLLGQHGVQGEPLAAAERAARLLDEASLPGGRWREAGTQVTKVVPELRLAAMSRSIGDLTPQAHVERVHELLARPARDLSQVEWLELQVLTSSPPPGTSFGLPDSFASTVRELGAGRGDAAAAQRIFDAHAIGRMDTGERLGATAELLGRDATTLSNDEWRRLSTLLDDAAVRAATKLPNELPGAKPLRQIAREVANGDYRPTSKTQRYFDLFQMLQLDDAGRVAAASKLFERPAAELSTADWRRLSVLLDHAPTRRLLQVPEELTGTKPLSQIAREIANGEYRPTMKTQRYFEVFRLNHLTTDERLAQAQALFAKDASALTAQEWTRLSSLLEHDATRTRLGLPHELPDTKPLRQIAAEIANGEYRPTAKTQAYFELFRIGQQDPAERLAQAKALFAKDAAQLTTAEWRQLAAMLDHPATRQLIDLPSELAGTKPLRQIAVEVANGEYRPTAKTQRYFELFRLNAMSEQERMGQVAELFSRDATDLSSTDWARLSTLLEHPSTARRINVPAELPGTKPLRQIAVEVASGEYRPTEKTQAYFVEWRRRNDPAYQQRVERALADVVAGTANAEARGLVAGEWSRLEQIVAGRPPDEQAAIAMVMMGVDSVAGSRSVKSTLEVLRDNVRAGAALPTELEPVRSQTIEMIDRNLARLDGKTPAGAIRGYSNHPDYAEIGRIRANVALMHEAQAQQGITAAAATADQAGAATATAATATGETLSW
jgi:hypothetical protein